MNVHRFYHFKRPIKLNYYTSSASFVCTYTYVFVCSRESSLWVQIFPDVFHTDFTYRQSAWMDSWVRISSLNLCELYKLHNTHRFNVNWLKYVDCWWLLKVSAKLPNLTGDCHRKCYEVLHACKYICMKCYIKIMYSEIISFYRTAKKSDDTQ